MLTWKTWKKSEEKIQNVALQADLVVARLKQMVSEDARALHVKPEVMAEYQDWNRETMKVTSPIFPELCVVAPFL